MSRHILSTDDRYRLALTARVHARTVRRWLDGERVRRGIAYALEHAVVELGLSAWAGMTADGDKDGPQAEEEDFWSTR